MTSVQKENAARNQSRRKKLGRAALYLGLSTILVVSILSLSVSIVSSYSGVASPESNYFYLSLVILIGILLVMTGLVAIILPEGPSRDGVWDMNMSSLVDNN
jgi:hypothetical protein